MVPSDLSFHQKKKFMHDGIIHPCVTEVEMVSVLEAIIHRLLVGIIVVFRLHTKFCSVNTIGKPFIKTLMILPSLVRVARERVELQ